MAPGGTWLLFAYLGFARALEQHAAADVSSAGKPAGSAPAESMVAIGPTKARSEFAESLARRLAAARGIASDVYWGSDGFCVDLAAHAPESASGETIGILCDTPRFHAAEDPMEWDVFRTGVLESQGWQLHRVWTPHFFRDPLAAMDAVSRALRDGA